MATNLVWFPKMHKDKYLQIKNSLQQDSSLLLEELQNIQREFRCVPPEAIKALAECLRCSEATIYGVVTFYEQFSLTPKGKFEIKICDGTACHINKSKEIHTAIREKLGLTMASQITTADAIFTIEMVSCLGACGLAPVLSINNRIYPKITVDSIKIIIDNLWQM